MKYLILAVILFGSAGLNHADIIIMPPPGGGQCKPILVCQTGEPCHTVIVCD